MRTIYLNNATTAYPRAPGAEEALRRVLFGMPEEPGRSVNSGPGVMEECRKRLAGLMGVEKSERIALLPSATYALNTAILGMNLQPGERVITTVLEHNSILRPLHHLSLTKGIKTDIVGIGANGRLNRSAFLEALQKSPRLVIMSHASNVTGQINDEVEELFCLAKEQGAVTLLDAVQTLGRIKVSPSSLYADMVAFAGHKGLRGPLGVGGLYVSPDIELEQIILGGTGVASESLIHPGKMPVRLEAGTPNMPAVAGLNAALKWLEKEGDSFFRKEIYMAQKLRKGLREIEGIRLVDDEMVSTRKPLAIVSFTVEGCGIAEIGSWLKEEGIICRTGFHCAPLIHEPLGCGREGTIRLSSSGFTTEVEIEITLLVMSSIVSNNIKIGLKIK